jgi:CheY-specific phosphatase CheX
LVLSDVRLLNPFVRGAFQVLESLGVRVARAGAPAVESGDATTDAVTVIVPIAGAVDGGVLYGFDQAAAQHLAGILHGDPWAVRWDDGLVETALGEFGTRVSGHASSELEDEGIRCAISPPIVTLHARMILSAQPFQRLVVSLSTSAGPMRIHLALHDGRASA